MLWPSNSPFSHARLFRLKPSHKELYIVNPSIGSDCIRSDIHNISSYSRKSSSSLLLNYHNRCVQCSNLQPVMSDTLRKRSREPEVLPESNDVRESKRFNGEETDLFLHLILSDKALVAEEEVASREDFVSGIMKSLEEEISATCSTFYAPNSGDNSLALDICSGHEGQILFSDSDIDLCYLLEASDDELGIPSSPVMDSKDDYSPSIKETLTAEGLSENPDLKCQGENWDFENEFENYQQFALYEDAWGASQVQDNMNSQDTFFDGDFSAAWISESSATCM